MKRYFLVKEYFGSRLYDSLKKSEFYLNETETVKIKEILAEQFNEINQPRVGQMSAPLKISMNLTKLCNLRCKQCFSNSGVKLEKELTTKDMYKLFDAMYENGTFFICLGGGEPLTRKDLLDILKYGKSKQLAISIVSNGLLLNKELIEKLNEMNLDYFWVSFEGLKENHEYLRGAGTFDKTLKSLELLKKFYKGKTALRMSINKRNLGDVSSLIKIAENYNIDLIRFTPLLDFGRAKWLDITIDQDQYIRFLDDIKKIKSKVKIVYPNMPINNKIWVGTNGFGCHCGKEAIWIDEVGNCSPCIFWGEKYNIGNIKQDSYVKIWEKSLNASNIAGNKVCLSCKNYLSCRGGCRARSLFLLKNLDDVDPLCPLKKNKQS